MAEVDQFPQDLHQETPEDVSPGSDDNQTSHLPKKTYASVAEKSFNESESENANTPVANSRRPESKGVEDSDSPTGSSEPLITVEHLDSLIERHPLSSVGMPELGIIVGGIVGIWTFVELFGFSLVEVISFAVSVLIIVSGGMKIARRSSITLHVEADESALRNTAKTFTEGFIWCVKHLESASRWSSVDHSLAVAACSWLIYRFVFILNMTVLSMLGIAFTLVPLLRRILREPQRSKVSNLLQSIDKAYMSIRRLANKGHNKISELHDRQQAVTLGAIAGGAVLIYLTRNIIGFNPWITLASMIHLGSYVSRKSASKKSQKSE